MRASNVLGIIYSNVYDEYASELTSVRTMGSVPFAGRYRLIDFILSGMVNCGMTMVGVSTKANYRSLMDHIGNGKPWDLSRKREGLTLLPPFSVGSASYYKSRLEALKSMRDYISYSGKKHVVFSDCNVVCSLDYSKLIEQHEQSGADITIAYKRGISPNLPETMILDMDGDRVKGVAVSSSSEGEATDFSLNIIVMQRILVLRLLDSALAAGLTSFERDLIAANVGVLDIRGYKVDGFAKVIDSLASYYDISMSLVNGEYKNLFSPDRPVYTKVRDDMPAIYGLCSRASDSLIANGCTIKGTVENSILFRGVYIAEGAVVKNSVIMQDCYISQGARVSCAILDKSVVVRPNLELSGAPGYPFYIGKNITV